MSEENTITLTKPVKAHGQEISEITLREPNGEDITVCGYPLQVSEGAAIPQAGAISKYIARLGDIPPSTVKKLCVTDYNACLSKVLGFFGQSEEEEKSPA